MIDPQDILAAHTRIKPHLRRTPVLDLEAGALCDAAVSLKLELFQHTGSFKVRGAMNTLLAEDIPPAGVVAYSGGNHGAAVAYAARKLGIHSTVFVPELAGPVKIARMKHFGAKVIVSDRNVSEVLQQFQDHAERTGALAIHPYDGPLVLAGQGTVALEIEQQLPDLDTLLVSVGGGGLIGGIAAWYAGRTNIVAVETEATATLATALKNGPEAGITPGGIAASALGAGTIGALSFELLDRFGVQSLVLPDTAVIKAQKRLWGSARIVAEPGAATALAALSSGAYIPAKEERTGVLVCGGNALPDWFLD